MIYLVKPSNTWIVMAYVFICSSWNGQDYYKKLCVLDCVVKKTRPVNKLKSHTIPFTTTHFLLNPRIVVYFIVVFLFVKVFFFAGVHLNWIYVNPLWNHRNWTIFSNIHLKIDLKASLSHFMVGYNQSWEIIIVLSSSIAFICKGNHAYWVIFLCCCSLIVDFFFWKLVS